LEDAVYDLFWDVTLDELFVLLKKFHFLVIVFYIVSLFLKHFLDFLYHCFLLDQVEIELVQNKQQAVGVVVVPDQDIGKFLAVFSQFFKQFLISLKRHIHRFKVILLLHLQDLKHFIKRFFNSSFQQPFSLSQSWRKSQL